MLELNPKDNEQLMGGSCPTCGKSTFLHGPKGGNDENIRCEQCGSEFWFSPPFRAMRLERDNPELYHESFDLRSCI